MNIQQVTQKFVDIFGEQPTLYTSPGRINLIGEHTDYNGGFVFPGAVDKAMVAAIKLNGSSRVRVWALNMDEECEFGLREEEKPNKTWACYIFGVCREIQKRGYKMEGFDAVFCGDVPLGAGMSSSAALESVFAYALNDQLGLNIDRFELALIGQATEHNYCGVMCGIMDQFASLFGKAGHLVRLDCKSLEYAYFPFDAEKFGYRLALINSKVKHELVGSPYNERRSSCERVAGLLGRKFLRGVTMEELNGIKESISAEDYKRACYVVGEEWRVMEVCKALEESNLERVGEMMYGTHKGLSEEYEVSCEELDMLVEIARECGVSGARIMGGGFGGCTINLVREELYDNFIATATERFAARYGHAPEIIPVVISDGARRL